MCPELHECHRVCDCLQHFTAVETLGHSNGNIRLLSQEIVVTIYLQFGFLQIKDFAAQTNV